jgi:phosphocarrier protein HPr
MIQKQIKIINKLGLHARAAAKFVSCAAKFSSELEIKKGDQTANGKSIMGVMMLAASQNTEIDLFVDGIDEQEMMDAMTSLIESKFGEAE